MTNHDAIFTVVMHRYIENAAERGEQVTEQVEANIRTIAVLFDVRPKHTAVELGFRGDGTWSLDAVRLAKARVRATSGLQDFVDRLWDAIGDLSCEAIASLRNEYP